MIEAGFYRGRLWHRRFVPAHAFERDLLMVWADVEAIDAAPGGVLSFGRGVPFSLRRADHLPSEGESLADTVRALVRPALGRDPEGPMGLLSQPRALGLTFDPVSFVYCLDAAGEEIEAVVAEVTNTPWGERHAYVLTEGHAPRRGHRTFEAPKTLHVSPFFGMDHDYRFDFSAPGSDLRASILNRREGEIVFEVGLALERVGSLSSPPWASILRHAWMPAETVVGIYAQALRLFAKRAPFHPHPRRLVAGAEAEPRPRRPGAGVEAESRPARVRGSR